MDSWGNQLQKQPRVWGQNKLFRAICSISAPLIKVFQQLTNRTHIMFRHGFIHTQVKSSELWSFLNWPEALSIHAHSRWPHDAQIGSNRDFLLQREFGYPPYPCCVKELCFHILALTTQSGVLWHRIWLSNNTVDAPSIISTSVTRSGLQNDRY